MSAVPTIDPVTVDAIKFLAVAGIGYVWQWARSMKNWHNGTSYIMFGVFALAAYFWATPAVLAQDWRLTVLGVIAMVQQSRGSASISSDVKIAPATNAL